MIKMCRKKITFMCFIIVFSGFIFAKDISGIYKTQKGTEGGQSIVEIFKYNDVYYIYGLKNLDAEPIKDSCNKNADLRNRLSVGNVFAYDYKENKKGQIVDGIIYNFYNCKFYYSKIIPKNDGNIEFVGALDSYYIMHKGYIWEKLSDTESKKYQQYRKDKEFLIKTANDTRRSK